MKKLLLCFMMLFYLPVALAMEVKTLYDTEVMVNDRSQAALNQVLPQAMAQVLVKVSGHPDVAATGTLHDSLSQASNYMMSYSYTDGTTPDGKNITWLNVSFDPTEVDQLLRQAGQPIWGADRPQVLIWLAVPGADQQTTVATASDTPDVAQALTTAANARGLPILLPLYDLTDEAVVSADAISSGDLADLQKASQRYQTDHLLIGHITSNPDGTLTANWSFEEGSFHIDWQNSGKDAATVAIAGINQLANTLAEREAAVVSNTASPQTLNVQVTHVDGLKDYADVVRTLKSLSPVTQLETLNVAQSVIMLSLTVAGGQDALLKAVSDDGRLVYDAPRAAQPAESDNTAAEPQSQPQPQAQPASPLILRWVGQSGSHT